MFRYTIIDVGDEQVVFNKNDGALVHDRRDSWPPRFPTEEEVKYDRQRLKTERLERQARLEEDVRRKRVQTISTMDYSQTNKQDTEVAEDNEQGSEDSGIVSFREEDQTAETTTRTEEEVPTREIEDVKLVQDTTSPSPRSERTASVAKSRTTSIKSLGRGTTPIDNVHEDPGAKPYITAPGRRRAPKEEGKKKSSCCTIL